jgi:hypothetical protein
MDPKPRPNHRLYLQVLQSMTVEEKLLKTFELSALGKELLREGLRKRFPEATEAQLHQMFLNRLARCHNQNY